MRKHKVSVNGETFTAARDDVLLDAALMAGVDIPHDCRVGQCGSCAVRLVDGQVHRDNGNDSGMVLACQSRIIGDARVVVEDVPSVEVVNGRVAAMAPLTTDTVELRIETARPLVYLPGQYFHIRFRGFPERCYNPTVSIERPGASKRSFHLQINRLPDGRVSNALGRQIRKGHQVTVTGPFGHAFLRPSLTNRLMLVATGTGFAAIWSIATAALAENPNRKIVVIAGGKTLESLYMSQALQRLAQYPNVEVIPTTSAPQNVARSVRQGQPTDHMPDLNKDDIVYVCGAPPMVEAVRRLATAAGASCYASPFVPLSWITGGEESLLSRALNWITGYGEETLVLRALSWITSHSSQAIESEPEPMDQRQPSYTFRELLSRVGPAQRPRPRPAPPQRAPQPPRPAPQNFGEPRPARQNFGEQRPTPRHFAEPRPVPQNFGQPNFAEPRPASQLRPPPAHPRLIETPPRAAPQRVYVPPRPQPQPSGQLQPQAEARQQAKAQLYGEPQPRPLQPAARSARPVFISVPEESQGIRAKAPTLPIWHAEPETAGGGLALPVYISIPSESEGLRAKAATIPMRHTESVGGGLALSEESAASADEAEPAVSDRLDLALSSESPETNEATEDSETVAPESTSTFSGKSLDTGSSSSVTIDAATTVRPGGLGVADNQFRPTEANFADGIGEVATTNSEGTPLLDAGVGDLLNDHGIGASLRAFLQADLDHDIKRPVAVEGTDVDGTPREFSTVVTMPSN